MKNYILQIAAVLLFLLTGHTVAGYDKRNLLTGNFSRKQLAESLSASKNWLTYPSYSDRVGWSKVPEAVRNEAIKEGEKYVGYDWPVTTATMYLEFTRSGNRALADDNNSKKLAALRALTMAELAEGEGRFLDDLVNGVFAFCEQTYWGSPAHFYMYGFDRSISNPSTVLPDNTDPVVDLVVGDAAADLAWVWHFFREPFDQISPVIAGRLRHELQAKVLTPFYQRNDYWWITGWDEGRVNNWTPWCSYNMLVCILLLEENPQKALDGIYKTMGSVDLFINAYPEDGGCSEGPGYWAPAGGKMFDYLDLLKKATGNKIDIFRQEIIRNIGRYIYRVYVGNGVHYVNFADAQARLSHNGGRIYRYGERIEDPMMQRFGAFLLQRQDEPALYRGRIGEMLENLFDLDKADIAEKAEPLLKDHYFPNLDVAIARDREGSNEGFYFAVKGGHNGEQHNHNDVGSFILHYDGQPVLIDIGVGTYTRETFSADRYKIWTMQSDYHNVPLINGVSQSPGRNRTARNSRFSAQKDRVVFSTDISSAYPPEAKVRSWERTLVLERGKRILIKDQFGLEENKGTSALHFMTGTRCKVEKPGIISLQETGVDLQMKYNAAVMEATIEKIQVEDPRLVHTIGSEVYRIVLAQKKTGLTGDISVEIHKAGSGKQD